MKMKDFNFLPSMSIKLIQASEEEIKDLLTSNIIQLKIGADPENLFYSENFIINVEEI